MGCLGGSAEFQHIERAANFFRQRFALGRVIAARASQSMELRQRLIMIGAAKISPSTRTIAVLIQTPEFRLLSSTSHPPCSACS